MNFSRSQNNKYNKSQEFLNNDNVSNMKMKSNQILYINIIFYFISARQDSYIYLIC
jgi:hypothetical protein